MTAAIIIFGNPREAVELLVDVARTAERDGYRVTFGHIVDQSPPETLYELLASAPDAIIMLDPETGELTCVDGDFALECLREASL